LRIGRVYKITSPSTNKVYIGSTIKTLNSRLQEHKTNYKKWKKGKYSYRKVFKIMKYKDAIITKIEKIQFIIDDWDELRKREQYHINNTNHCVNQSSAFVVGRGYTPKEHNEIYRKIRYTCKKCDRNLTLCHKKRHERSSRHRNAN
jgi:hypothetical protein